MMNQLIKFLGDSHSIEGCNNDVTSKSAAVRLSNDLFCSYNANIRPVLNQSSQTSVDTQFYVFNVHMVNKFKMFHLFSLLSFTGYNTYNRYVLLLHNIVMQ